ncbi:MAG: hypothetical protein WBQ03_18620 [Candidatus Sulfotelmatobacter sp.]
MHVSRLAANTTIWTLGFVLQCVLAYVVFRRGAARRFPVFALLIIFYPVRAALLFGLTAHVHSNLASSLFGVLSFADDLLQLMVAVELALHLIRVMGGLTGFRALVFLLAAGAASVCTWITHLLVPHRISAGRLQLFAWFVLVALFCAVVKGSTSSNLTRISAGFAVFSLMQLSALAGRTLAFLHRDAGQYVAWSYVPGVGYLAVVIFWLITLRKESQAGV